MNNILYKFKTNFKFYYEFYIPITSIVAYLKCIYNLTCYLFFKIKATIKV